MAGDEEPEVTDEEAAEIAAAFKKMMEDGIGDELPEMPDDSEVCCDCRFQSAAADKSQGLLSIRRIPFAASEKGCVARAAPGAVAAGSGAGDGDGQLAPQRSVVLSVSRHSLRSSLVHILTRPHPDQAAMCRSHGSAI